MAYHRSGHPGAVAVSFSTNTMPPLSPSQRYSSTTSTTTTTGISTTTTKYNTFRSPMSTLERNYTSPTAASTYRSRRIQCSPARSVSSFSETSSVVSSSNPKYSSTCNSSASSTVSSASSTRDRSNATTPAADLTAEEFYQKYSPTNYVPNIHNSNRETTPTPSSITLNGHCRKSYAPSGPSLLAELHGGDESIYAERRPGILIKRRIPSISGALFGHDDIDSGPTTSSPNEVTKSQQQLQQCNESSENHNDFNASDSNANNNEHNDEFNVNFNDVKLIDDNQKLQDTTPTSSTASSSPTDSRWCESDSSPVSDPINYLSTANNITITERAWKDNTNNDNNFLTNNNAQECDEQLIETDGCNDGGERLSKGKWLIANDIEGDDESEGVEYQEKENGAVGLNSYRQIDENGFRVTSRPSGSQGEDSSQPSTSRRTTIFWGGDTLGDDISATAAAGGAGGVPVGVHQTIYRGLTDQIEESSNARPARNRLTGRRDESYGLNGLRNIGNTCFMNSVIQCLSNTRPLLEYLLNEHYLNDINTTTSGMKGALIKSFAYVIHELWEGSGEKVVNTTAFKSQIQRFAPRFMGYAQQDAQEFLRYLLEGLHEDVNRVTAKPQPILTDIPDHYSDSAKAAESWKRYLRSEDSTIVDVFVGQLRSSLTCTACDHVSVTLDPFWDLSLPIPVRTGTVRLAQCLEHFTKAETLDGDEKPTCSKCQMRRKCTKTFRIQKFPKILVIHLKRFSPTERFRSKLSVVVDFPLTGLDLSAFAAPGVQGCTYNLYGVANHSGTPYSGHYTAYCKHPYSGEWHEYNDSRVSPVSASSVISSEAYVLFYEQQPLSPHL